MRSAAFFVALATAAADDQCGSGGGAIFCTQDETCCEDSPHCTGDCSECCLNQVSQCVAPRPSFTTSTCCPRWSVGCSVGTVGCCDPARPWQAQKSIGDDGMSDERARRNPLRARPRLEASSSGKLDLEASSPAEDHGSRGDCCSAGVAPESDCAGLDQHDCEFHFAAVRLGPVSSGGRPLPQRLERDGLRRDQRGVLRRLRNG